MFIHVYNILYALTLVHVHVHVQYMCILVKEVKNIDKQLFTPYQYTHKLKIE